MLKPTFVFRVDASLQIGSGHVMRCLTLAMALREQGANCLFVSRICSGNLIEFVRKQGFTTFEIEIPCKYELQHHDSKSIDLDAQKTLEAIVKESVDWLIVDHYGIDLQWESQLRSFCRQLMVIDDLCNRKHTCDLLIDQNLRANAEARYRQLVPNNCRLLLGPSHVILRSEFDAEVTRIRDGSIKHILIYFGGYDVHNQALNAVKALQNFPQLSADIVLGKDHLYRDLVHDAASPQLVVSDSIGMAQAMNRADLAIGVCGIAAWERCAIGLPTLVCVNADNQREDSEQLHRIGAIELLGESIDIGVVDWVNALSRALKEPQRIAKMGQIAREVVTGHSKNRQALVNFLCNASELRLSESVQVA